MLTKLIKIKNQNKWIILASILIIVFTPIFRGNSQELGKYIEQFEGKNGNTTFKVKILRVGSKEQEEVLIQFSGVDDPLNDKIYRYKKVWLNKKLVSNKYQYVTDQIPNKEKYSAIISESENGEQVFKAYLIENPAKEIKISPNKNQENLDPKLLYQKFLKQNN